MAKKIVFCADGTWCHPHSQSMVSDDDTNVYKMYKALNVSATQVTFYDDGVGADGNPIEHLAGGAFGFGLFDKIKQGYTAIAHVYEKGDQVYIFGFSRGAYTARSLAGMISACGLPEKGFDQNLVDRAFAAYRDRANRANILAGLSAYCLADPGIAMIGVWDTVGALGIPGAVFQGEDPIYAFLDTSLSPKVKAAYHALAIDERRYEFEPTLWTGQPVAGQIMEQVWFTGCHGDVGGGNLNCGLSDITLGWMIEKGMQQGLEFMDTAKARYLPIDAKRALDPIHETWNLLWAFPERRSIEAKSFISNSVAVRLATDQSYRPSNLTLDASSKLTGYGDSAVVALPKVMTAGGGR